MFFCCSIYIKTAQNSRGECNEFTNLLLWRLSLYLSRDSLSCDTRSLDLCILFKFIFLYLWYIPPHSCALTHFTWHQFFPMYITTRNIFLIPDDTVAQNLIIIFDFSNQRPHLNYIFLSTFLVLIQWNFPWNKCQLAHIYQQNFKPCCYCLIKVKA